MSARKVTPPTRNLMDDPAYSTCIANLRAAGYVVLSPDEVRGIRDEALDEAAKVAERFGPSRPIITRDPTQIIRGRWEGEQAASGGIAAAIRSLKGGRDAQ